MQLRPATRDDAEAIGLVLEALVAAGKRSRASDAVFVRRHYVEDPDRVQCTLALDDAGRVLGFQSLKTARAGNPYDTPVGWGIIGTHIDPGAARQGVGRRLFARTLIAARAAGLRRIDACIGADNSEGLAYYEAMGFRTYRRGEGLVCKVCEVSS